MFPWDLWQRKNKKNNWEMFIYLFDEIVSYSIAKIIVRRVPWILGMWQVCDRWLEGQNSNSADWVMSLTAFFINCLFLGKRANLCLNFTVSRLFMSVEITMNIVQHPTPNTVLIKCIHLMLHSQNAA